MEKQTRKDIQTSGHRNSRSVHKRRERNGKCFIIRENTLVNTHTQGGGGGDDDDDDDDDDDN
jgi:hypothetical protein